MPLVNRFPTYDPFNYYSRAPRSYGGFYDLWRETVQASACEPEQKANYHRRAMKTPNQKTIKIACVLLGHYQPEEISLEVDSEKIILHGQHQSEQEHGFNKSEFTRVYKIPKGIDPTTIRSLINLDNGVLVVEGTKHVEDKASDGKFKAKLDFRGFKSEEIKLQLRGNMLTVTGMQICERHQLRNSYSRCIVLPDDVDPESVTSCLSKEGLLTIKALRDPDMLLRRSGDDITITGERNEEPKQKTSTSDS